MLIQKKKKTVRQRYNGILFIKAINLQLIVRIGRKIILKIYVLEIGKDIQF
jgi:hypothetical protein